MSRMDSCMVRQLPTPGNSDSPLLQGDRKSLHLGKKKGVRLTACLRMSQYRGGGVEWITRLAAPPQK